LGGNAEELYGNSAALSGSAERPYGNCDAYRERTLLLEPNA
jgi:hypothetical protein